MISQLKNLLLGSSELEKPDSGGEDTLELAVAALMVEMARADFSEDQSEENEIKQLLESHFELTEQESADLLGRARTAVDDSVSLYDFTRTLHDVLDEQEKRKVILMLWKIALADNSLDKYEDYLIGKLAELLYVPRGDVIRLKYECQQDGQS